MNHILQYVFDRSGLVLLCLRESSLLTVRQEQDKDLKHTPGVTKTLWEICGIALSVGGRVVVMK